VVASKLRDRPTADLVILGLTGVVMLAVVGTLAAMLIGKLIDPDADVTELAKQIGGLLSSLIAVIVGYVGGRGTNDPPPTNPPPGGSE
jgi:Na+/H+ antiporter NhaA